MENSSKNMVGGYAALLLLGCGSVANVTATPTKSPNLIVIMCDDLGYGDVGFNGCKDIPTPNIDRIAAEGVKFTSGYTTYSVSSPSRAGFITGRYGQRFGYERNVQYKPNDPQMGLDTMELTLGESLQSVGYTTGVIGKWHLGANDVHHPCNRGFDEFFGHLGGGHSYMPEKCKFDRYEAQNEWQSYQTLIMRNFENVEIEEYLTDEFSLEAVDFVTRHSEEPFFLYLAYNAPHTPLEATEEYLAPFADIEDDKRRVYAAMVSAVDHGVGRLLSRLEELGLDDDTIIFFLSDNGGPEHINGSDNGELRAGKSSSYEGGFRVPFAMRWSGVVEPQVYDNPVSSLDIFATISSLSSSPTNEDRPLDGVNLIPFVTGEDQGMPHSTIYLRKRDDSLYAVRHLDHKLLLFEKGGSRVELYNLETDISESHNIAKENPKIVKQIERLRKKWDSELIEPKFEGLIMKTNKK